MKSPISSWLLLGGMVSVAVLLAVPATAATPEMPMAGAEYVGTEQCLECHDDKEESLAGTPHGSNYFGELSGHGCETCHGPGGDHIEDPEGVSMRLTDQTAEQQTATCQTCHSGREQFFWKGGAHESRGLSCLSCHSIHDPGSQQKQLQAATVREQCYSCHKDIRAQTWKTSHHPIREGQISCTDCHNPHGSTTDKMLRAASVNDQCYTCHAEKRGPFLWEHPPVRESCTTCHAPHGSNHTKLKVAEVPYLCQRCHSNTRHPGTLYDGSRVVGGEAETNRAINRGCVNCHAAIHGSNHPSSPYLSH